MCAQLPVTYIWEGPEDDWITVETCSPIVISKNKCCADAKTDLFTSIRKIPFYVIQFSVTLCYSYGEYPYFQYLNQQKVLNFLNFNKLPEDGILVPKHTAVCT